MKNARSHDISRAFVRLFSFLIVFQSCLQELDILRNVLVIRIRFIQRATFIIYQHIEGLCIGTEFNALEITPLIAYCTQCTFPAVSVTLTGEVNGVLLST